jgi:hypothetical protein
MLNRSYFKAVLCWSREVSSPVNGKAQGVAAGSLKPTFCPRSQRNSRLFVRTLLRFKYPDGLRPVTEPSLTSRAWFPSFWTGGPLFRWRPRQWDYLALRHAVPRASASGRGMRAWAKEWARHDVAMIGASADEIGRGRFLR